MENMNEMEKEIDIKEEYINLLVELKGAADNAKSFNWMEQPTIIALADIMQELIHKLAVIEFQLNMIRDESLVAINEYSHASLEGMTYSLLKLVRENNLKTGDDESFIRSLSDQDIEDLKKICPRIMAIPEFENMIKNRETEESVS